uniref:S-locus F-box-like protein 5 n=1 Tax=Aquilegia coerulea TaxID=218851 RepID=A0A7L8H6T2_AQUCA|nr:S-locus F-box-like protein 5 [Aquilegia coerulea]
MAINSSSSNVDRVVNEEEFQLPEDIVFQILLWLPVVSLLRFKSVCKSWYSLIQSPRFISQHYNNGTQEEENYNNYKFFILQFIYDIDCKIISYSSSSRGGDGIDGDIINTTTNNNNSKYEASEILDLPEYFKMISDWDLQKMARKMISCKGIICLHYRAWNVYLWNPATKQFRILPQNQSQIPSPGNGCAQKMKIGFGFDVKTNDYKVVRFVYGSGDFPTDDRYDQADVYSLSTNTWKSLDFVVSITDVYSNLKMPFRNGEIYCWIVSDWDKSFMLSFNCSTEVFATIPLPDDPNVCKPDVAILRGKIALISCFREDSTDLNHFQIWVMNDYGVKDSWTRIYTVGPLSIDFYPIGLAMNGNLIFLVMDQECWLAQLCLWDVVTQQITFLPGQYSINNIGVAVYKECLLSV